MRGVAAGGLAIVAGLVSGSLIASVYLTYMLGRDLVDPDILLHARSVLYGLWNGSPYLTGHLIVAGAVVAFLILAAVTMTWERLVSYGQRRFQSPADLKRNDMVQPVGYGFVLGERIPAPVQQPNRPIRIKKTWRLTKKRKPRYIAALYSTVSNVLLVGPTRSGKGVSFVIPNALTFPGSMVVLDVKGELWDETARAREQIGDAVFRFAPLDFENPTHQYNPLARLEGIEDMEELWTGLARVARLFLQIDNNKDWLSAGILLFVAAGILASQRDNLTMGEIYRIIFGAGEGADIGRCTTDLLSTAARECKYPPAARELNKIARQEAKIQQSNLSVLSAAGLDQWANPRVERVTRRNDFDFTQMRRKPMSVYLHILSDDMEDLNSLVRLFFADLISFLRSSKPGEDEPLPIFMLLDEFDQLGRMPLVVRAMKQTAGHGGRFAIVTQSIPGLLSVPYSPEEIKAIESACQVKLYIAASEDQTASELETALGTRTGATMNRSHDLRAVGFGAGSVTRGTEHRPVLSKQEIRDMDPEKIIILPERQNPILADRIKYYESRDILKVHAAQTGRPFPYPEPDDSAGAMTMTEARRAAKDAADVEASEAEEAKSIMTTTRGPKTAPSLQARKKKPVKSKPSGKISAEAQVRLEGLRRGIAAIEAPEAVA